MDIIEPGYCSVISLINDARKELNRDNIERMGNLAIIHYISVEWFVSSASDEIGDAASNESDESEVVNEFEVDEESEDESDVTLIDETSKDDSSNRPL
ncbi:hypothetical protein QYF36_027236 [Acer negundo]|nr:hypothetical protein QYF36_027236 [Acer negundo]